MDTVIKDDFTPPMKFIPARRRPSNRPRTVEDTARNPTPVFMSTILKAVLSVTLCKVWRNSELCHKVETYFKSRLGNERKRRMNTVVLRQKHRQEVPGVVALKNVSFDLRRGRNPCALRRKTERASRP